jgi:hypothetical protein
LTCYVTRWQTPHADRIYYSGPFSPSSALTKSIIVRPLSFDSYLLHLCGWAFWRQSCEALCSWTWGRKLLETSAEEDVRGRWNIDEAWDVWMWMRIAKGLQSRTGGAGCTRSRYHMYFTVFELNRTSYLPIHNHHNMIYWPPQQASDDQSCIFGSLSILGISTGHGTISGIWLKLIRDRWFKMTTRLLSNRRLH